MLAASGLCLVREGAGSAGCWVPFQPVGSFVGGEPWYGYRDAVPAPWRPAVDAQCRRDVAVNRQLEPSGWRVLQFRELRRSLEACVEGVTRAASE